MLAEWSPVRAVLLAWPYADGEWSENYEEISRCYAGILQALCEHVETWVLVHPACKQDFLQHSASVHHQNLKFFEQPYNDTWVRDYGPLSLNGTLLQFQFDGWGKKYRSDLDNAAVNTLFANPHVGAVPKLKTSSFIAEGGALEVNDDGVLLANRDCLLNQNRNPGLSEDAVKHTLQAQLGVRDFVFIENVCLSGDDTDGHIDTLVRFVNNEHLVFCGPSVNHPDIAALKRLEEQLHIQARLRGWQLTALPTPCVREGGKTLAASYANFLICNECVFVPSYDVEEDGVAEALFKRVFPQRKVIMLSCRALLKQNGSLHCATMQLAEAAWQSVA